MLIYIIYIIVHVVFQTYLVLFSRCIVSCKVSADLVAVIRIRVWISVEWRHLLGQLSRGLQLKVGGFLIFSLWICTKWTNEKALVSSKHPLRSLYAAPILNYFDYILTYFVYDIFYHLDRLSDIISVCSIDCNAMLCLMIEDGQKFHMNAVLKKWVDRIPCYCLFEKVTSLRGCICVHSCMKMFVASMGLNMSGDVVMWTTSATNGHWKDIVQPRHLSCNCRIILTRAVTWWQDK